MRRFFHVAGAVALLTPMALGAQVDWAERGGDPWLEETPGVRVWIEGSRSVSWGGPVRVRFEVSDDAYVVVGRVNGDGRLTILFPQGANRRSFVNGRTIHAVRGYQSASDVSFFANDQSSGFVFALASYTPLDLSRFEARDFRPPNVHLASNYSMMYRSAAYRPDEYVSAFAQVALWGTAVPYDYDVDYYYPYGYSHGRFASWQGMCRAETYQWLLLTGGLPPAAGMYGMERYRSLCQTYLMQLRCSGFAAFHLFGACPYYPARTGGIVQAPPKGGPGDSASTDTSATPNVKVLRNGLWGADTVGIVPERLDRTTSEPQKVKTDARTAWDGLYAIPSVARQKLKDADVAVRDRSSATTAASYRPVRSSDAPTRVKTVASDVPARTAPARSGRTSAGNAASSGPDRYSTPNTTRSKPSSTTGSRPSSTTGATSRGSGSSDTKTRPAPQPAPTIKVTKPASSGEKTKPPQ